MQAEPQSTPSSGLNWAPSSEHGAGNRPPRRRFGCVWAIAALLMVALIGSLMLNALSRMVSAGIGKPLPRQAGSDEMPHFREIWSAGHGEVKVVRIPLTGMILFEGRGWSAAGEGSATMALRSIRRATADPAVQGLLLEIDSGGGGITASDILYQAVRAFRDSRDGRVVVVQMGDVAASGAYYVAMAADRIVAYPTTITGSIGVLIQSLNVHELAERWGIRDVTVKSGDNKDLLNPLRAPDDTQHALLQEVVDAMHARFVELIAESRDMPLEKVQELADGRVFLAQQALAADLIDRIGYAQDAQRLLAELLGEDQVCIYRYEPEFSLTDLFRRPSLFGIRLPDLIEAAEPRLYYRWMP